MEKTTIQKTGEVAGYTVASAAVALMLAYILVTVYPQFKEGQTIISNGLAVLINTAWVFIKNKYFDA